MKTTMVMQDFSGVEQNMSVAKNLKIEARETNEGAENKIELLKMSIKYAYVLNF